MATRATSSGPTGSSHAAPVPISARRLPTVSNGFAAGWGHRMTGLADRLLSIHGSLLYVVVALLVFAEDALFIGFVIPGETAAVLGGVVASRGHATYPVIAGTVVIAAIAGDTVGYEVGRFLGPHILNTRLLNKRRRRLDQAQEFLRRRGGAAVFLGRFVAFFRAVTPALAGSARMRYLRFLAFNAAGGLIWGVCFTLLGYLASNSYKAVEKTVGRAAGLLVLGIVLAAFAAWRIRSNLRERRDPARPEPGT
jgi:membrane-associated protein